MPRVGHGTPCVDPHPMSILLMVGRFFGPARRSEDAHGLHAGINDHIAISLENGGPFD